MTVREVQSSDAKAHLTQLLSEVEHGETIVITRHGRAIARLIPEVDRRKADILKTMEQIVDFRSTKHGLTMSDILSARHEGHRY